MTDVLRIDREERKEADVLGAKGEFLERERERLEKQREGVGGEMKAVEEERGSKGKEREGRWGAWQPPEAGNLTPRTSRPSGQLTAISSMR